MIGTVAQTWDGIKRYSVPDLGCDIPHDYEMRNRDEADDRWKRALARNVERLMQANGHTSYLDVVRASGGRVSNGTIGRIRSGQGAKLDTLLEVAQLYRVELYQLLAPEFEQTYSEAALNLARAFDALAEGPEKTKAYAVCRLQLTPLAEDLPSPEALGESSPETSSPQPQ